MGQNLDLRLQISFSERCQLTFCRILINCQKKQVKLRIYGFFHTVKYPVFPISNIKGNIKAPILKEKGTSRKDPTCFQPLVETK